MITLKLNRSIVFFDLETTGLDILNDRIVQIALIRISPNLKREKVNLMIDPGIPIKPEAQKVHNISNTDVQGCPKFHEIAQSIYNFIGDSDLAGYNIITFDLPLLIEEFGRAGIELNIQNRKLIDLFKVYAALKPRTLAAAFEDYVGGTFHQHDAYTDTEATITLYESMIIHEKEKIGETVDSIESFAFDRNKMVDLAGKFIRDDNGTILLNFGSKKGLPASENKDFLKWMLGPSNNFTDETRNWTRKLLAI